MRPYYLSTVYKEERRTSIKRKGCVTAMLYLVVETDCSPAVLGLSRSVTYSPSEMPKVLISSLEINRINFYLEP